MGQSLFPILAEVQSSSALALFYEQLFVMSETALLTLITICTCFREMFTPVVTEGGIEMTPVINEGRLNELSATLQSIHPQGSLAKIAEDLNIYLDLVFCRSLTRFLHELNFFS